MYHPYANAYLANTPQPVQLPVAQMAPQGIFGDILGAVAPIAGQVVGSALGQPQIGTAIGQAAGQLGGLVPFAVGPSWTWDQTAPVVAAPQPQLVPQGIFGDILGAVAPVAGSVIGGLAGNQQLGSQIGNVAGQVGGLLPFSAGPAQMAPQGLFGDIFKTVAPVAGSVIGGLAGNQQAGAQIGNIAGQLGGLIPFSAGPGQPVQYAPQGLFGDIFKTVAPVAGSVIGGLAGNQQAGAQIGNIAGQLGGLIPFSAGPGHPVQYAPQGLWGDVISKIAPVTGSAIGGAFGNQQLGSAIGNVAGQVGSLLPFSAGPAQMAPQGLFGDIFKTVAPVAGSVIGGLAGNQQAGAQIGNIAGQLGGLIPFSAGPGQPVQYAPQGLFGDILGAVAPVAGSVIGGLAGNQQLGSQIGNVAGQVGGLLPFSAGPAQMAPQGLFGDIFKTIAPVAGSVIGGLAGNQQAGAQIGNIAGQLGGLIPFSAGPGQPVQYAPQGLFGDILGAVAPVAGSVIGGLAGNQQAGAQIGNIAGQLGGLIPFSAGPGQPVQYAPQGLFGDILKTVAPVAGNVIGGLAGNQQLGSQIGGIAGQVGGLLPFSAGPAQMAPQGLFGDILGAVAPIAGTVLGGVLGQPILGGMAGSAAGQAARLIPFSAGPGQPVQYAPQGLFGDILGAVAPIAGTVLGGVLGQPVLGGMAGSAAGQAAKLIPFSAGPGQVYAYQQPQQPMMTLH